MKIDLRVSTVIIERQVEPQHQEKETHFLLRIEMPGEER